ncbi:MAG TPA: wax ester/triacylglycerol synthase family O-acyltransferase [Noviherbaspirillum sp.]
MSERIPMSIIDAAWLRMDRPSNLMMICGMLMFADRVSLDALRNVIDTRMLCFHRFRQRVIIGGGRPQWEADPDFSLDWHVRHIAAPAGEGMENLLSELVSTPLDPSKPMWQFHLVDLDAGTSAVVMRMHHCYGDGFALMHVLNAMTDTAPDQAREPADDATENGALRGAWERVFGSVSEAMGDALRTAGQVIETGMELFSHPDKALEYGKAGYAYLRDAAFIATMTPDTHTRFKGPLGVMKRVAWAKPLSLFEVKAVGDAFGCSVNDVLLACVAGTLRHYLSAQGDAVDGIEMRALVPVNCRPHGPVRELGNMFGLVFLSLPLGVADPFERLIEVRRRMDELKHSQQPGVALGILASMGVLPEALKESVLESLAANASAVITNVRGSSQPQYLAGKRIERQVFWVPQSGGIGMGISILSYAGKVDFGVVTDVRRVSRPDLLVSHFIEEFEKLLFLALLALSKQEHDQRLEGTTAVHAKREPDLAKPDGAVPGLPPPRRRERNAGRRAGSPHG